MEAKNFSLPTINLTCSDFPISAPCESLASISKNSFLPSVLTSVAVAETVSPIFDGLRWVALINPPTVVSSSAAMFLAASIAAFSIRAIIAGVAKTGMSPEPIRSAVLFSFTLHVEVCDICMGTPFRFFEWKIRIRNIVGYRNRILLAIRCAARTGRPCASFAPKKMFAGIFPRLLSPPSLFGKCLSNATTQALLRKL